MSDVTLQINLSAGDINYAMLTVPAIVAAHRGGSAEVLAVVDCCRPQRTIYVDPDVKFPVEQFQERVSIIRRQAEELLRLGHIDRVYYLESDDPLIRKMAIKYLVGNRKWMLPWVVNATHDSGGCGYMSYIAGLEVPRTRYVLHYDADMLVHTAAGYNWADEAIQWLRTHEMAIAATPRVSPPFARQIGVGDGPSLREGLAFHPVKGGWRQSWFSTRCILMDNEKLAAQLPLFDARTSADVLLRWAARRSLPRSFECLLFRTIGMEGKGCWRLTLSSEDAWLIHPASKPRQFIELLPGALFSIRHGDIPMAQRGQTEFDIRAWAEHLSLHEQGELLGAM